jgi:FtsZ-interacting cell division protein ZipA
MAKRAKGLKILKIIIILAITFLAGIIVTFCQKQSKPVVTDENRTTQTTSSKSKKHIKAEVKKDKGRDTKVSVTINAPADETNGKDKKTVDENGLTPAEAEYYKKHHLNPQPTNDPLLNNDHYMGEFYSDDSEPEYNTNDNASYYVPNTTTNSSSATAESYSSQTTVAENNQSAGNNYQGGGNYGNN